MARAAEAIAAGDLSRRLRLPRGRNEVARQGHAFDHMVERLGIDGVGLGSDFDGATIPAEIGDVSGLPRLLGALRASGFDDDAMRKVTHENWIRVLRKTWKD